jgi:hypothetical protein
MRRGLGILYKWEVILPMNIRSFHHHNSIQQPFTSFQFASNPFYIFQFFPLPVRYLHFYFHLFFHHKMSSFKSIVAFGLLATAELVAGHGAIIAATGNAGGSGMALGVDTATPRDGTRRDPFQQDSTRFKGDQADTFGETLAGGNNNLEAGTKAIMAETGDQLPQVTQGGEVQMTLHQVNADGGGKNTISSKSPTFEC